MGGNSGTLIIRHFGLTITRHIANVVIISIIIGALCCSLYVVVEVSCQTMESIGLWHSHRT